MQTKSVPAVLRGVRRVFLKSRRVGTHQEKAFDTCLEYLRQHPGIWISKADIGRNLHSLAKHQRLFSSRLAGVLRRICMVSFRPQTGLGTGPIDENECCSNDDHHWILAQKTQTHWLLRYNPRIFNIKSVKST